MIPDYYARLVESCDDAIVAKTIDGTIIGWNAAAERLFGYSAEEMVGRSIRHLLPADREHEEDEILGRISQGEVVGQFLTKRLHKDGSLLDISASVSPVRDGEGRIVGLSKIARNAGPYLENQRRIREADLRFRMMADNISQLAWMAHPDGSIFWYNQRWYDYTGTDLESMQGFGWQAVHHPEHVDRVTTGYRLSVAAKERWEDTFPLRGKDGQYRWYLSRALPVRGEDGEVRHWFGTNTDITEQREQAEQIRVLLMEVNHRSKNMLAIVQALARRTAPDDAGFVARFEERVRSLAVNQDILVRREWRDVPVLDLVQQQLRFVETARGGLMLDGPAVSLTPRAAEVIGMALHELATNSLKHGALSRDGGKVTIGWDKGDADKGDADKGNADKAGPAGFRMFWREEGGPPVAAPQHIGFGTSLISDIPRRSLSAEVTLDYPREGVRWELSCGPEVVAGQG
ncbi:PAS domain S-box protein [Aurantiacibacter xanthus]|uniref:histidine kinase n=1 Tax=Aurantiacibacter xanthus TaxID=1784712 RepID=A0A3A1PHS1_9SPHN|nr:PAS domain S-box protein [Aurantiacibacter xanthus]